ncbi:hypothetical protein L195_g004191 [Trifolium pratense]|uniref:RNase H type-1 domain-containing protein n=1 Tax=Trifolium pratense TaxID=57577 RepID=A0A2K3NXD9_TRIPR|nr:hypothetical protein L195_g004191 [Trifolium pratense]
MEPFMISRILELRLFMKIKEVTLNLEQRINAILTLHEDKGSDSQLGTGTYNKFSIASMYEILCEFNKLDDEQVWLDIWKLKGTSSAYVAELWGVLEGLRYTWRLGFRKVELSVDSVAVVKIIKEGGLLVIWVTPTRRYIVLFPLSGRLRSLILIEKLIGVQMCWLV